MIARVHAQFFAISSRRTRIRFALIIDGRPPEFDLSLDSSDRVAKGEAIRVTASVVRTLSDMAKFDYGFQGDAEKQFKDKAKSVEVRGRSAAFALPTKDLDAGEYTVLVRGENKAGNADFRAGQGSGRRAAAPGSRESGRARDDHGPRHGPLARRQSGGGRGGFH